MCFAVLLKVSKYILTFTRTDLLKCWQNLLDLIIMHESTNFSHYDLNGSKEERQKSAEPLL